MKKSVCISCTQHYHERTKYILSCLREQGYECVYLTSDFSHMKKERFTVEIPDSIQIPTRAYKKNISLARILSHMKFAKDAIRLTAKIQPDLLYVELPPNSLCREAAKYKRKNPNVKLIFDVFDMWPETFPSGRVKKLLAPVFSLWAAFRDQHLGAADVVTTECGLFRDMLASGRTNVPMVSHQCCRADKYIHQRRDDSSIVRCAFFHIELEDDEGTTVYLPGQIVVSEGYSWSDGVEPVLLELLEGITLCK